MTTSEALQLGLDRYNEDHPAEFNPLPWQANYRHQCPKARIARKTGRAVSAPIPLKERYVTAWITTTEGIQPLMVLDAELAIIFREGKCRNCLAVARSIKGQVVKVAERPPLEGRVARD